MGGWDEEQKEEEHQGKGLTEDLGRERQDQGKGRIRGEGSLRIRGEKGRIRGKAGSGDDVSESTDWNLSCTITFLSL